ncbi:hypothetical protein H261_03743 [Paramagnetospirillum caucaseum]|uniref:HPr kinase n=1 Tax=Paramagnetospirillum caucaseum TaxID=1244869 RepID=M2ZV51_9PROT|nr:hypothetical protein [Paramagnetospirillum caucaseum]EME71277.1 hypothetical protein H261_03743 [Paramagnetospirillum caucaseum]
MSFAYMAYGLHLSLPFSCPSLLAVDGASPLDLSVVEGVVPQALSAPTLRTPRYDAAPGLFLWKGDPRGGRFLVEGGQRVTVERNEASEDGRLAFHFIHSILAAVMRQRGHLVLHGNAAVGPRGVSVLCGRSGAGKSTTHQALLDAGWKTLSDDVTVLAARPDGGFAVLPGNNHVSMCLDAAERLGKNIASLPRNPCQAKKVTLPAPDMGTLAPLAEIVILDAWDDDRVESIPLIGAEKFAALHDCIYGPLLPEELGDHFTVFSAVAGGVPMRRVCRPNGTWTIAAIMSEICRD